MNTVRIILTSQVHPDEVHEIPLKTFGELTVADYIRIHDTKDEAPPEIPEHYRDAWLRLAELARILDCDMRLVRGMSMDQAEATIEHYRTVLIDSDQSAEARRKMHETLEGWAEAHDGNEWTIDDAAGLLRELGIFRDTVVTPGGTYTAPLVEHADFGRWLTLQSEMMVTVDGVQAEAESYVRALAVMMEGQDGPFPVQHQGESDGIYQGRIDTYTSDRRRNFMAARYVDVMGCAAFFFSKSQRFAELCGHNMSSLNSLLSPQTKRERIVIPTDGASMLN